MKNIIIVLSLSVCFIGAFAQEIIKGNITDTEGVSLIGATVKEYNTYRGTVTDLDGNFELNVSTLPTTLSISYIGYKTQSILIESSESDLKIILQEGSSSLDEVVVVGSRGKPRTILSSPVPIDNINAKDLQSSGQSSIDQMINYKVPSYNSTNQTISDATAHFDPSELRNMGPSRTLVLVNGKRKNQSSLVYVNDTPGKGEVGVDMKSIPTAAIERVEVLRDGASAQYGSDAIAGVINIILKERTEGSVNTGIGITAAGDGLTYNADVNKGFKVGNNGNLNLTASYYHQDETNRAGEPGEDALFGVDSSNEWIQENPDLGMTVGQPAYDKISGAANLSLPYNNDNAEFYVAGSYTKRLGKSFALYRTPYWIPDDAGLLTSEGETYQGFQPTFETNINDWFANAGTKNDFNGWKTDLSVTAGQNTVDYTIGNTINVSLLPNSPTEFDAGAYKFGHILGNLDVSKSFGNLSVFAGTEARMEFFEVVAGQDESWVDGGAQSFPGLQPGNALEADRTNVGLYAGADYDITENTLVGAALRFENFSDFGSNLSWKINGRQLFNNSKGVVRASLSTGFRAPSLHQIYLSNIQTLISGGTVSNQGTFNNVSPVIESLGIPKLDAEQSFNISAGFTYKITDNFNVSLDYYNIDLNNRVLFTGEIGFDSDTTTNNAVEEILIRDDVTSIKFFVNAMDTRTQGVDLVANYDGIKVGTGKMGLIMALNFNSTKIDEITVPGQIGDAGYDIFNRKEQSRVTTARPNFKGSLGINYRLNAFTANLNNTYFGEVTWQHGANPDFDQTFAGKLVTDLILGYKASDALSINLTAKNLFNVYPDEINPFDDPVTDLGGRFRYPWEVNQFGFNGTTLYLGVSLSF